MPWENISHKGLRDLSFADCFCPFRAHFQMMGISAHVQKIVVGRLIGRDLLPPCFILITCSMCFQQVLPQTSYFAKSEIQAVPLAFPPRKINKRRRQLLFKLGASVLPKVGPALAAVIPREEVTKTLPLLRWLQMFSSFMSWFLCAEAVPMAGYYYSECSLLGDPALFPKRPSLPSPSPQSPLHWTEPYSRALPTFYSFQSPSSWGSHCKVALCWHRVDRWTPAGYYYCHGFVFGNPLILLLQSSVLSHTGSKDWGKRPGFGRAGSYPPCSPEAVG